MRFTVTKFLFMCVILSIMIFSMANTVFSQEFKNVLNTKEYKYRRLTNLNLVNFQIDTLSFVSCTLINSDIRESRIDSLTISNSVIRNFNPKHSVFSNVRVINSDLDRNSFIPTGWTNVVFSNTSLRRVDLSDVEFNNVAFDSCDLTGAVIDTFQLEKGVSSIKGSKLDSEYVEFLVRKRPELLRDAP